MKPDRRRTKAKVLPAREALSLISTDGLDAGGFADRPAGGRSEEPVAGDGRRIQVSGRRRLLGDLGAGSRR